MFPFHFSSLLSYSLRLHTRLQQPSVCGEEFDSCDELDDPDP